MLVIRRHPGETIQIGVDVEILVIDCGNGRAGAIGSRGFDLPGGAPAAISFLPAGLP